MKKRVTEKDRQEIREYNKKLSGSVKDRCKKLKTEFGFCHDILSGIIRNPDSVRKKRDISELTQAKIKEIKRFISNIDPKKSDLHKMTSAVKHFNRSITDIRVIYTEMKNKGSVKMFDYKQEFHGFI